MRALHGGHCSVAKSASNALSPALASRPVWSRTNETSATALWSLIEAVVALPWQQSGRGGAELEGELAALLWLGETPESEDPRIFRCTGLLGCG